MRITDYNCTIGELYGVCRTGWHSYEEFLTAIAATRGYYTAAYGTAALAEVDAAELLPDDQARYTNSQVYRVELTHFADACLAHWQMLKRYILTSFPPDIAPLRLEEAGALRYLKASQNNWDELRLMNVAATTFITTYDTELSAGMNMPATFPTAYAADIALYNPKMNQFVSSEESGKIATAAKINANNSIYAKLMNMFKDGQEIFDNDEEIKDQFTFSKVLELYRGHGQAGTRGIITNSVTGLPIEGAEAMVLSSSLTNHSDVEGHYLLKPMASGYTDIRFSAPGYRDIVITQHHVIIGTVSTLDVQLDPEP